MTTTTKGYYSNILYKDGEIATALNGQFQNGFTTMHISDLTKNVEGRDLLLTANLRELVKCKKELKQNKEVVIYLEWALNDDRSDYTYAKATGIEIRERDMY